MKIAAFLILLLAVGGFAALFVLGSAETSLSVTPAPKVLGVSSPFTVQAANPHGVRSVAAYLEQGGVRFPLFDHAEPATRFLWKRHVAPRGFSFEAGKNKAAGLKEGKARLVVEAVSNDFRAKTSAVGFDVNVSLTPPRVAADGLQHYINQGGMELATFTAGGAWSEAGVKVGDHEYRSFPLPGRGPEQRFSMFAFPWNMETDVSSAVFARNLAGNEATAHFMFKLFPKKFRVRDFPIDDALMQKLVDSVDPNGAVLPGKDLVSRFLYINGELRKQNNKQLADLRLKTEEKVLWDGPFIHWGKEEANFADVRNYIYHGQKIDQQVHLGFDLADVTNGPVKSANDGKVVWAAGLGIYGNCVVVDHGYGLQSVYGHMQSFDVKEGDMVKKGQKLGTEGQTGLAGGIHLHFSMQIDGVQINPREWWDEHWIKDRILSKLQ